MDGAKKFSWSGLIITPGTHTENKRDNLTNIVHKNS